MTKIQILMNKRKVDVYYVASEVGVSSTIVKKWCEGTTSPRLIHALRLKNLFGNALKLSDLLSKKDQKKV